MVLAAWNVIEESLAKLVGAKVHHAAVATAIEQYLCNQWHEPVFTTQTFSFCFE